VKEKALMEESLRGCLSVSLATKSSGTLIRQEKQVCYLTVCPC